MAGCAVAATSAQWGGNTCSLIKFDSPELEPHVLRPITRKESWKVKGGLSPPSAGPPDAGSGVYTTWVRIHLGKLHKSAIGLLFLRPVRVRIMIHDPTLNVRK